MDVSLDEMLDARERRVREQRRLLNEYKLPLICLTLNIAGPKKDYPLARSAFYEGVRRIRAAVPLRYESIITPHTGCEGFFIVHGHKPEVIKRLMVEIEERDRLGRIFDIDVIDVNGSKLSRDEPRKCFICDNAAAACARNRSHTAAELERVVNGLIRCFYSDRIAQIAYDALILEVETTPKPGLVDSANSGAHDDMDIDTFRRSAKALKPYFKSYAMLAMETSMLTAERIMEGLKTTGRMAENAMYAATGGINTHKGINYSMGLLCAAIGICIEAGIELDNAVRLCSELASQSALNDFTQIEKGAAPLSHGEALYLSKGIKGVRGEAIGGFPCAVYAKNRIYAYLGMGLSQNDACVLTLAEIMAILEDSNVCYRSGTGGLRHMREAAKRILALPVADRVEAMRELDGDFIGRRISPGGCADTLAMAIMMHRVETAFSV